MNKVSDFDSPDFEGFKLLLEETFVEFRGMTFRKGLFDMNTIKEELTRKNPIKVQREVNHTHLFLYSTSIEIQRRWAEELERKWRQRIRDQFPDLTVEFVRDDDGTEVILSFWALTQTADSLD